MGGVVDSLYCRQKIAWHLPLPNETVGVPFFLKGCLQGLIVDRCTVFRAGNAVLLKMEIVFTPEGNSLSGPFSKYEKQVIMLWVKTLLQALLEERTLKQKV